jgi:hypothetical protein
MRRFAVLCPLVALLLVACEGTVTDPVGDAYQTADVVEAGVDYGTATTTFWLRYVEGQGPAPYNAWHVSMGDDTVPEAYVTIGGGYYTPPQMYDHYVVARQAGEVAQTTCSGFVEDQGFDGIDTVSITIDSRCLLLDGGPPLPDVIRVRSVSASGRYGYEETDYTGPVSLS